MDSSQLSKGKKSPRGSPRKKIDNKPKRRSLVERELETTLTDKITSPIMKIDNRHKKISLTESEHETSLTDKISSPRKKMYTRPKKRSIIQQELETNVIDKVTFPRRKMDCEHKKKSLTEQEVETNVIKKITFPQEQMDIEQNKRSLIERELESSITDKITSPRKKNSNKPKKRSIIERELETNLTDKITSPITYTEGSPGSTSRYGRARKFKADQDFCNPEKMMQKISKSPKREAIDIVNSPVSPVYKMHASNSSINESPKAKIESPIKAPVDTENRSSFINDSSEKKKAPKIYVRTDLIQGAGRDSSGKMLRNMFSPKRNTHLNNILERSSGKHSLDSPNMGHIDNSSVVKTLDFDTGKAVKIDRSPQSMEKLNLEKMCLYQVGDLAWARVGSYPFWPCIVSRDPYSECFVKKKVVGRLEKPHVHVIFFGDNGRRGWIPETMLRAYEGIDEFETFKEQLTPEAKKKDPKLYAAYFISEKKSTKWRVSVDEAENLLKEPKDQRLDILNEMLIQNRGVKTTPNREKGIQLTRKSSDVSLSESLYDTLFSEDDTKPEESDNSRKRNKKQSLDVSDVVTACLDNMAAKTGITKIQKQSHMDRWLLKAKTHTPEKKVKTPTPKVRVRSVDNNNINNKTTSPVGNKVSQSINKSNNKKILRSNTELDKKKLQLPNDDINTDKLENISVIEDPELLTLNSSKCDLEAIACKVPKICNTEFLSDKTEGDLSEAQINSDYSNLNNVCINNTVTNNKNAMEVDDIHSLNKTDDVIVNASSDVETNNLTKTDANLIINEDESSRLINLEKSIKEIITEPQQVNETSVEICDNGSLKSNLSDSRIKVTKSNELGENKEPKNLNDDLQIVNNDVIVDTSLNAVSVESGEELYIQMESTENKEYMKNRETNDQNGNVKKHDDNLTVITSIKSVRLKNYEEVNSQMEITENNELMENSEMENVNGHIEFQGGDVTVYRCINDVSLEKGEEESSQKEITENSEYIENREPESMNGDVESRCNDGTVDSSKNDVILEVCQEINSQMEVDENNEVKENREPEPINGLVQLLDNDGSFDGSSINDAQNYVNIDKTGNGDLKYTKNDVVSPEICRTNNNTNSNMDNSLTNDEINKDSGISNDHLEHSENEPSVETFEIKQNVNSIIEDSVSNKTICKKHEIPNNDLENCQNYLAGFENSSVLNQNLCDMQETLSKNDTCKATEITNGDLEHPENNEKSSNDDIKSPINNERIKETDPNTDDNVSGDLHYNGIPEHSDEEYDEYSHLVPLLDNNSVDSNSFSSFNKSSDSNNSKKVTDVMHNLSDVSNENKDSIAEKMGISSDNAILERCDEKQCVSEVDNLNITDKSDARENRLDICLNITNDENKLTKHTDTENKFYFEDDIKLYFDDDVSSEGTDTLNAVESNLKDNIENYCNKKINDIEADVISSENTINLNIELDSYNSNSDEIDENRNDHENLSRTNENFKDPNFLKYVELKQDSVIDENPGLTNNDILSYLYKIWSYEQELKTVEMKNDEIKESTLVKGLSESIKPKKRKSRNASSINKMATHSDDIVTDQYSKRNNIAIMFQNKINEVSENRISKELQSELDNKRITALEPVLPLENSESVTDCEEEIKVSNIPKNRDNGEIQYRMMANPSKNGYNSEFMKFLEVRQDAVLDENPNLSEDDLKSYLYSTWKYEQSLKSDEMKNEDLQQLNLIKGLGPEKTPNATRKHKKKVYTINEDSDEDAPILKKKVLVDNDESNEDTIILKKKPKGKKLRKKVVKPFYNELDFSNSENEDDANGSPKSDKSSKSNTNTDGHSDEMFPKPELDEVEYYFSELTAPKPNLFKGLIKERVCEICEKAGRLVKCKGPCGDMFHLDCVEKQTNLSSNNSCRGRKKKHRGKPKSLNDSESQSDDRSQEAMSVDEQDNSIEDEIVPIVANVEDFEATLESKMKEIMENPENLIYETHYNSDDAYDWDASVAIPRDSADAKLNKAESSHDGDFRCNNCQKYETPLCFVCKSTVSPKTKAETRQKCNVAHCHKFYHVDCMEHWPQTQFSSADSTKSKKSGSLETISCPRHVCHTCVSDDPRGCKTRFSSDKLAKCVRCPAVYHSFTKCLPAGTQILTGSQIICPRHYEHRPGKIPCHVNTRWCFICALGGTLICCEYCPTSFHAECLNIKPPEGGYMCEDCETGRLPLYGEMVWVKLGHYRWWPGLVLHPGDIPPNIMSCKHQPGEFVVRFFGQYDYYWVNRGRVFAFQEGDTGTLSSQKTKIDAAFHQAMEDAQRACQILKEAQANEAESTEKELSLLPPHYVKLKVNKPCGSLVNWKLDTSDANSLTQCECNPDDYDPCGPDSHCLNRMLLTECGPTCRADERCNNRSFEKRRYPKLAPYRTPARGWGLKTLEDIRKGQFVIEYVGELIDEEEFRRRMRRKHEMRDENFYFLTLDKDRMIDAGPKGNLARFMNHCCEPNCETQKWTVLGDVRVGLFAMVDIPANTEVTFNYNLESAGIEKKQCMCGAKRCSGYIGAKPKQEERPKIAKRVYKKRKTNSVESPSTSQRGAKLKPIKKPKPKELTEIEKDLLIIKNATNGISSDSEPDRLAATENVDSFAEDSNLKRKRVDFSADESACDTATVSPIAKKTKPESDALSEVL